MAVTRYRHARPVGVAHVLRLWPAPYGRPLA